MVTSEILDFAIGLNNTKYLSDLEKSSLWWRICELTQASQTHNAKQTSFERMLLYFLADWARKYQYDHFGRQSIFAKQFQKIIEKVPAGLKSELNAIQKGETVESHPPSVIIPKKLGEPKKIEFFNDARAPANVFYRGVFKVSKTR